jgi:OOP family OmpA-OmpF porin
VDPRRPAKFPRGTHDPDSDGDGVPDRLDKCPDTPRGVKVDKDGCPLSDKEVELLDTGTLRLDNVHFELNEAILLPESHEVLDEVGEILAKWDQLHIEIGGHTDNWGEVDYNRDLSERRAQAVLDYLVSKFAIRKEQFQVKGYGEGQPVTSNDTPEGRAKNRRVEFTVLNREILKREN